MVSLGGVLGALSSPVLGRVRDRRGARLVLCLAVLLTGTADMLLSLTNSLPMFYLLFRVARMNFAGPFDLGIFGAVNHWFVAHRPLATSIAWADYYGRVSYGAIRGIALSVLAQASGPLLPGILRDWSDSCDLSLRCFVVLSCLSVPAALLACTPKQVPLQGGP
jgi:MFS family permease